MSLEPVVIGDFFGRSMTCRTLERPRPYPVIWMEERTSMCEDIGVIHG